MLENASRQLFLVLLTIAVGLVCVLTLNIPWGIDLKGGTQLVYELPRDVLEKLRERENVQIDQVVDQAIKVIAERIDPTGTLDPLITRSGETGILIELPFFKDPAELKRVLERVGNLGRLELRIVADKDYDLQPGRFNLQVERQKLEAWLKVPENAARLREDARYIRTFNENQIDGPAAFGKLAWYAHEILPTGKEGDTWDYTFAMRGSEDLKAAAVKFFEDADFNGGKLTEAMRKKEPREQKLIEFLALNMVEESFTGEDLNPAEVHPDIDPRTGGQAVAYAVQPNKMQAYADWSGRFVNKHSAIVLNGIVKSAPVFQGRIPGRGIISGGFTKAEVEDLVKVLRTGSLRVEPDLQSNLSIGPNLGEAATQRGMLSLAIGAVLVFVFMLWYYGVAGSIACVTLVLNIFLLWAGMVLLQATVTLPGLAGIVLTMGMAVDANVLIYERIREELERGKDMLRAVRAGFERAMSAILDSNITTFLVGLVLYNVGVGPVRGFAVTLMVGIVTTVFTQFFVTRLLFHFALEKNKLSTYKPRRLWADLKLDYVKWIKPAFATSLAVIVVGLVLVLMAPRETVLGIDFTGGANLQMVLATPMHYEAVQKRLADDPAFAKDYPNVSVNSVGEVLADETAHQFNLRLKLRDSQREVIDTGRRLHREARQKALEDGTEPPSAYEPPYVTELRRIFGKELVQAAFADPRTLPSAQEGQNTQYAQIDVNFVDAVDVQMVRERIAKTLTRGLVTPRDNPTAATSKQLRIEWVAPNSLKPWQLAETVGKELDDLKRPDGESVLLSEPFPSAQEMQGRLVNELRNAAIGALLLSWGLIVLYLRVRFHEYKYGIAAVVALVHDVLIALIAVVLANRFGLINGEINLAMIACFLTIIGYSVNDTIVIFDRIRENAQENVRQGIQEPFRALINRALNQTMSRTLLTSGLTLLVVIAQFAVNYNSGSDLEGFAFAMIIGMVSGVYSTIYIAAPILIWLDKGDLANPTLREAIVDVDVQAEREAQAAAAAEAAAAAKTGQAGS
ncbi:MAG: protein translocase subunit SecD [Planctomycetes bacterium]|nr:protein translocase subunit SecD [Planctomycetota bacterium]